MTVFWILAGLLMIVALLFVLLPLLGKRVLYAGISRQQANLSIYRDQLRELDRDMASGAIAEEQYKATRYEIESRALEEAASASDQALAQRVHWGLVSSIGVVLPVVAIATYLLVGTPAALTGQAASPAAADGGHAVTPEMIQGMVSKLAQRLKDNPEDAEGWLMLAKSYTAMKRFPEAAAAYREAVRRLPPDAQILVDYADALAMASGRSLQGEPAELVQQALKVDPANVKALALAGTVAYEQKDYPTAASYWKKILTIVPPESEFAQRIMASVADAESLAAGGGAAVTRSAEGRGRVASNGTAGITGRVALSPDAQKAVKPSDTIFVFARAATGPRIPVAVFRANATKFPMEFKLDDSLSLAPNRLLSQAGDLLVGARVSPSGSATPSKGDWETAMIPAKPGSSQIELVVDRLYVTR